MWWILSTLNSRILYGHDGLELRDQTVWQVKYLTFSSIGPFTSRFASIAKQRTAEIGRMVLILL